LPHGPAAVVLPDRNRRTRRPALRRLRVGLLQLRVPHHDKEAEGVRRYSVSSVLLPRSYSTEGGKTSIPEHAGTAGAAVAAPAATLRYSVSSMPAPLTPHPTGSGALLTTLTLSPGEAPAGAAAEAHPSHRNRAASGASRHSHPAAGRAGGAGVPRPRSLAYRGVPLPEPCRTPAGTLPEPCRQPPNSHPIATRQPPNSPGIAAEQVPNSSRTAAKQGNGAVSW